MKKVTTEGHSAKKKSTSDKAAKKEGSSPSHSSDGAPQKKNAKGHKQNLPESFTSKPQSNLTN